MPGFDIGRFWQTELRDFNRDQYLTANRSEITTIAPLYIIMKFESKAMPIQIDPISGLKVFNTRASRANENISGSGYALVKDESLKTLPPPPPGAAFNAVEQEKYRDFKEARKGAADYMALEGEFSKYLEDVYSSDPVPREALTDECEILVVGAGFAGLLLWYKLREACLM